MWYAIGKREVFIWHGATFNKNLNFFHNYSNKLVQSYSDRKISKKNLSQQIDIDPQTLTRCIKGENFPSVDTLLKLGKYTGKSVSYLIGENEEETANETTIVDYLGITNHTYNNLTNIRNINKEKNTKKYDIFGEILTDVNLYETIITKITNLSNKNIICDDDIEFLIFQIGNEVTQLTRSYISKILKEKK